MQNTVFTNRLTLTGWQIDTLMLSQFLSSTGQGGNRMNDLVGQDKDNSWGR